MSLGVGGGKPYPTGSADLYDLTGHTIAHAVNWPSPPVTTRDRTVTTAAQFNTEAAIEGTLIRINTSFTGQLDITADHIDVICDNSVTLGSTTPLATWITFAKGQQYFRWTGGTILMGDSGTANTVTAVAWNGVLDHLWDNVVFFGVMQYGLSSGDDTNAFQRVCWLNSTVDHSATAEEFCFHCGQGPNHSDLILCNVRMEADIGVGDPPTGSHSTTRIQNTDRVLVLDCSFNMGQGRAGIQGPDPESTGYRMASGNTDVHIEDTLIGGRFHASFLHSGFTDTMNPLTAINVTRYFVTGTGHSFDDSGLIGGNTGTVNGCQAYAPTGAPAIGSALNFGTGATYTGSNPNVLEWVDELPANLPDVTGIGADH